MESITGALPECIAPFWRPTFTNAMTVEIQPRVGTLDLNIRQQASDGCHLQVGESQSLINASPWPYDEFDCALVPSTCGLGCHFRLKSSEWGCPRTPPDVWIVGINLTGMFDDASQNRIQGTMAIGYAHRPGQSANNAGYSDATVVQRFQIGKVSR